MRRESDLRAELTPVEAERQALGDTRAAYAAALADHEQWLIAADRPERVRLREIAHRLGQLHAQESELREASTAGKYARGRVVEAANRLDEAAGWSDWDLFGGGMITDAMKYDRLDQASELMRAAATDLQRFGRELRDVRVELDVELDRLHAYTNTLLAELRELRRERETDPGRRVPLSPDPPLSAAASAVRWRS